jgi:hypothetical protein
VANGVSFLNRLGFGLNYVYSYELMFSICVNFQGFPARKRYPILDGWCAGIYVDLLYDLADLQVNDRL